MQELPPVPGVGSTVEARGSRWTVVGFEPADGCTAVDLVGVDGEATGQHRTLLVPFDDLVPVPAGDAPRRIRLGPALKALARLASEAVPWPAPFAVVAAAIDVLPHQLSAAIAFRTDAARRVLLADAVGSGKTIQAGIAIAETVRLERDARVLVVAPAGLKPQWGSELRDRFGLEVSAVDGAVPAAQRWAEEPESPWGAPGVFLASLDYVKRPEVIAHLRGLVWHLVVVDEAHHATRSSDRGEALDRVCRLATRVLLITATPHDGDEARFGALCQLGCVEEDRVLVLRRSPSLPLDGGAVRTHPLVVEPSGEERHTLTLLSHYVEALRRAGAVRDGDREATSALLAAVFQKRATSSPAALQRTALRRLRVAAPGQDPRQSPLPWDLAAIRDEEDEGEATWVGARGPLPWAHERARLGALADAAGRARRTCAKLAALRRLLRRLREPAIVFTEYRDTLAWLVEELRPRHLFGCLHGLQSPSERLAQVEAFTSGAVRFLLATDVAAEGLNLQTRCRVVVEFDRPWTPVRSEQRVGRVHRLGQRRRVHAWTLATRDAPDAWLEHARRIRAASAKDALAHVARLDEGHCEFQCAELLRTAKRLARGASASTRSPSSAALMGATPRLAFASRRRLHRWGVANGAALLVAHVLVGSGGDRVLESAVVPLKAHLNRGDGGRLGFLEPLCSAAHLVIEGRAHARLEELRAVHATAAKAQARWALATGRALGREIAARLEEPPLFADVGATPLARPVAPSGAAACGLELHVSIRIALIVLPDTLRADWRRS